MYMDGTTPSLLIGLIFNVEILYSFDFFLQVGTTSVLEVQSTMYLFPLDKGSKFVEIVCNPLLSYSKSNCAKPSSLSSCVFVDTTTASLGIGLLIRGPSNFGK